MCVSAVPERGGFRAALFIWELWMRSWWIELCGIAWPPYRRRIENHRAWCMVLSAGLSLLSHDDWDRGDLEAGRILGQKLKELNG